MLTFFDDLRPCLIGLEACAGTHWWARVISAFGHEVRLMLVRYVRPYVKPNKNDEAEAKAICEAVTRPSMRFVPIKDAEQQSVLLLHRTRELLVRQRTRLTNAFGHLGEFGIVVVQGARSLARLVAIRADTDDKRGPLLAREALSLLVEQLRTTKSKLAELERDLLAWYRANEVSQRLVTVPESARSRRPRSWPPSAIRPISVPPVNSPPGSASSRVSTRAVARSGWAGSASAAIAIFVSY
jgi:transposase